ncbi:MAG: hypothetical protein MJB57_11135, partial [Gemmatimonadetes bacterium]|nr:hypothetical protein [Gemmatimonadota bacterium]
LIASRIPYGDSILIRVTTVDGQLVEELRQDHLLSSAPSWSPSGDVLALIIDVDGLSQIGVWEPGVGGPRPVTAGLGEKRSPVWLSASIIAYIGIVDGVGDLIVVDIRTGESRQITQNQDLHRFVHRRPVQLGSRVGIEVPPAWVERLELSIPERVSPGETIVPKAALIDARGDTTRRHVDRIRLSSSDPTTVEPLADGSFVVVSEGVATIVASYGGWRADTVTVEARRLEKVSSDAVFVEDWTRGLSGNDWMVEGEPAPFVERTGGPAGGGMFFSNGDQNYTSGVFSRRAFDWSRGLTIETYGRTPFDGSPYQNWRVAFGLPANDTATIRETAAWIAPVQFLSDGLINRLVLRGVEFVAGRQERRLIASVAPNGSSWHKVTLQLDANGTASVFVDGTLVVRAQEFVTTTALPPTLHVWLGGSSVGTRIAFGPVQVYERALYEWPAATEVGRNASSVGQRPYPVVPSTIR